MILSMWTSCFTPFYWRKPQAEDTPSFCILFYHLFLLLKLGWNLWHNSIRNIPLASSIFIHSFEKSLKCSSKLKIWMFVKVLYANLNYIFKYCMTIALSKHFTFVISNIIMIIKKLFATYILNAKYCTRFSNPLFLSPFFNCHLSVNVHSWIHKYTNTK